MRNLGVCLVGILVIAWTVLSADKSEPAPSPVLNEILSHYSNDNDSLKRTAALFLIENMEGHSYVTYDLTDTNGRVIEFDILDYETYEILTASFDSLEDVYGALDFKKRDIIKDDSVITVGFLIEHIDHTFEEWTTRPWAAGLTFDALCEYVLPYRGSNEPLELWRSHFNRRYDSLFAQMQKPEDPIEAAALINRDLMSWFHFDPRFYYHPTDQSLAEMETIRLGRCEDMTNLTIYAMRANGLAVTSDYTPYWANSGNNHAWNAIVTPDGKVIPFMGAEADPGTYRLANKLAKVYRKTYSIQRNNLVFLAGGADKLPSYLASKSYLDVTGDYTPVRTISLAVTAPDSVKFSYLCVFNSGEWKPIHWSKIIADSAIFTDMGVDVAYLPATYIQDEVIPAGPPFILTEDGAINARTADTSRTTTLRLSSTTRVKQESSTDGVGKTHLTPGTTYTLHCWNEGWQSYGSAVAGEGSLVFTNIPSGCLYWLTADNSDREERIFTYENDAQIWW